MACTPTVRGLHWNGYRKFLQLRTKLPAPFPN